MEQIFKLPISILKGKDSSYIIHHYKYYNGNKTYSTYEYEIHISHIKTSGEHYLYVLINDNIKKKNKAFKIRSITENSIKKLQERIDTHINKLGITTKFINSWQKLIDEHKQHLENEMVIEIKGDKVITKTGEHPIYFWQEDKSVEEINNILIENYNKAVDSYQYYIKQEDGE